MTHADPKPQAPKQGFFRKTIVSPMKDALKKIFTKGTSLEEEAKVLEGSGKKKEAAAKYESAARIADAITGDYDFGQKHAQELFLKAARLYLEEGMNKEAAHTFMRAGEYTQAGKLFESIGDHTMAQRMARKSKD